MKHLKFTMALLLVICLLWPALGLADYLKQAKRAEYIEGNAQKAKELYRVALKEDEDYQEAHLGIVRCLRKCGSNLSAIKHIVDIDESRFDEKGKALLAAEKRYAESNQKESEQPEVIVGMSKVNNDISLTFHRKSLENIVKILAKRGSFAYSISPEIADKTLTMGIPMVEPLKALHLVAKQAGAEVTNEKEVYKIEPARHTRFAKRKKSEPLRLQFKDVRLVDVVRMLSKAGDFQYVISPSVASKKLSLDLKDISPLEAMHIIANAAGADVATIDDRYTVAPREELKEMRLAANEGGKEKKGVLLNVRLVEMDGQKEKRTVASPRVLAINEQHASIRIGGQPKEGGEGMDIQIEAHPVIEEDGLIKVSLDCNVVMTKDQQVSQQRKSFTVRLKDGKNFRQRMSEKYAVEVRPMVIENLSQAHHEMMEKKLKARRRACYANQKVMTHALHLYLNDHGLKARDVDDSVLKKLVEEGYLTSVPTDPGSGKGSESHYKIEGDRVLCSQHGPLPTGKWMNFK